MDTVHLSEDEESEVQSLAGLFSELDLIEVRKAYIVSKKDYRAAQQLLAKIVQDPTSRYSLLPLPTSSNPQSSPAQGYDERPDAAPGRAQAHRVRSSEAAAAGATGLAAIALTPEPEDEDEEASVLAGLPAFNMDSFTETLSQVGATVTDGITMLATNLTSWVADLASALDGWSDETEERVTAHMKDKDEAAVAYAARVGVAENGPYQRRAGLTSPSIQQRQVVPNRPADQWQEQDEENDGWDDEGEDDNKDD